VKRAVAIAVGLVLAVALPAAAAEPTPATFPALPVHESRYYTIHSDLPPAFVREAELRMTRMVEEYRARTKGFAGQVRGKLAFHLFATEADYLRAGGLPGTAGMYYHQPPARLMAVADEGPGPRLWYTVQHEGFHQFTDAVTRFELPMWVHEGLAEYFGEMLFTGDAFVAGVVPPWRLDRVRATLTLDPGAGGYVPMADLLRLSHEAWNAGIRPENYDHVWSLAHFLVHAEGGRYRAAFDGYLRAVARGRDWDRAWAEQMGPAGLGRVDELERRWRLYWSSLPDHPSDDLYAEAAVRTLASLLARATIAGQRFDGFPAFLRAAESQGLKVPDTDWLPPSLGRMAAGLVADLAERGGTFALADPDTREPRVVFTRADGSTLVGRFTVRGVKVAAVAVEAGSRAGRR
jgi:hypothetical protein